MYQYQSKDQTLIEERVSQFRGQTERFLNGELDTDAFRALRLMNGLYIQTHAPMLRVAIPYGTLSSAQLRKLAAIARDYDKGYAHFSTRQNIQFNWPKLEQVPDILAELATVQMHAIQTSGNCIRNTTTDALAGVAVDELEDPRPYCEIIRQWSTLHPEFAYLPRKFKIAVSAAQQDRAATQFHDIGVHLIRHTNGELGYRILLGGGLGRTPMIGKIINEFVAETDLLSYLEAIVRIYNLYGRRDNKYKARIKILVHELGIENFRQQVENEWQAIRAELALMPETISAMKRHFQPPNYATDAENDLSFAKAIAQNEQFAKWVQWNTQNHKIKGYRAVFISLKAPNSPPGDITHQGLELIAELAEHYSFAEARSTHRQNLVLADVKQADLYPLWQKLTEFNFATPNIGTATDIICCPGLDFCSLANAGSIGIVRELNQVLNDWDYLHDLGDIKINISGCMNGCAHQSVGHIGILGVDKKGVEWYQITLGGNSENEAAIGERLGPSVAKNQIVKAITDILEIYLQYRLIDEPFLATVKRLGLTPFKEKVYAHY
ncbi:MAG: hypothetical protein RL637_1878 [Pseudomonadota bacterium]